MSSESPSVSVCGIVRNCESHLEAAVEDITRALHPIQPSSWMLIESDSSDATIEVLARLSAKIEGFHYETLGNLVDTTPNRLLRLATCRERYRKKIADNQRSSDWVIVVDFDGLTSSLKAGAIFFAIRSADHFDAMTASSHGPYYDLLALRKHGFIETDYRDDEQRVLEQSGNPFRAKFEALVKRQKSIPRRGDPIEVESAFGGLAIYKSECFAESSYMGADSENVCEHVTFHSGLRQRGRRIAILPALRVRPEVRHQIFAYRIWWPVWWVLSNLPGAAARPLARVLSLRVGREK